MIFYNTMIPYKILEHEGIQYSVCRDYSHISRCRRYRQLIHNPDNPADRFIALETPNPISSSVDVKYYEVSPTEVNRLDLIALKLLGSANYKWVLAYFNAIDDGFSVYEGQVLRYPTNGISALFSSKNEVLSPINPFALNLGSE